MPRRLLFAVRTSHPAGLRQLVSISPTLLAVAKGTTLSSDPQVLATKARSLKGRDVDQLLDALVNEERIDPKLIRALARIDIDKQNHGCSGKDNRNNAYPA